MPVRPDDGLLLQPDPDLVVKDPVWNPTGKSLSSAEIEKLSELMTSYRYYARTSRSERSRNVIDPALLRMEEAGAFVEYPAKEPEGLPLPATAADGTVVYSVSGASPTPGFRRLFYFYPEDYPEIYHEAAVEEERSLEAYVRAFELFSGPLADVSGAGGGSDR
jgi:hypothetical protein